MSKIKSLNFFSHRLILISVLIFGGLSFLFLPVVGFEFLILTGVVYFFTTCIGGTITYHRLLSHRSFVAPRWFQLFGLLCSFWGIYGSPLSWAAIHRLHHMKVDSLQDPHSPLFQPWWKVQFLSSLERPNLKLVQDLSRDPVIRFLHKNYGRLHAIVSVALILLSPKIFLAAYIWPAFLTWNLASLVNTLCHGHGYRNFETNDASTNSIMLGLLVFGEGWHNNHHQSPRKYSFRYKWWEIDVSEWIIKAVMVKT